MFCRGRRCKSRAGPPNWASGRKRVSVIWGRYAVFCRGRRCKSRAGTPNWASACRVVSVISGRICGVLHDGSILWIRGHFQQSRELRNHLLQLEQPRRVHAHPAHSGQVRDAVAADRGSEFGHFLPGELRQARLGVLLRALHERRLGIVRSRWLRSSRIARGQSGRGRLRGRVGDGRSSGGSGLHGPIHSTRFPRNFPTPVLGRFQLVSTPPQPVPAE